MATKNKPNKGKVAEEAQEFTPMPEGSQSWWPEEFASPLTASLAGAFVFAWSVLLFVAGSFNSLLWFKRLQLIILGVYEPTLLPPDTGSWDAACILWAVGVFFAAMVVHPSLALALLMILRPWLDAYTYPTDNLYFTWAAMLLMLIWGRSTRHKVPVFLFMAFFACILLSTYTSIHYNKSFRYAVFWAGHLALFVTVLNLAQQRRIFNILLCAFFVTLATEVLYAIPHYKLLLPYIRKTLMDDPSWMQQMGTTEMTPELARRFNVNRAFGNMLFPNALAGYYILCLPPLLAMLWIGCAKFKALYAQTKSAPSQDIQSRSTLVFVGIVWLITCSTIFIEGVFASALGDPKDLSWYQSTEFIGAYSVFLGLIVAVSLFYLVRRGGVTLAIYGAWVYGALLLAPALIYSLLTTFSRGAFLALFVALILGCFLYLGTSTRLPKKLRKVLAVFIVCAALAGSTLAYAQALNPEAGAVAPNTADKMPTPQSVNTAPTGQGVVLESGVDLSMDDLSDASTFKLRLSYWRVGSRMLKDYWLLGTGLGAFEMVYPKYQRIGDGEVREVHNSVLQMFIETGILGCAFFIMFWGYVLLWGLRRILDTHNKTKKILLCGMYTGLLAFLGHSLLDIHFSHHGLIFFLLILTALFIVRAAPVTQNEPANIPRWTSILVLGFCAITSGLGLQFFLHDFALSRGNMIDIANPKDVNFRMQVAEYFYTKINQYRKNREGSPPQMSYAAANMFFPSREVIEDCGELYVPAETGKGLRRLTPDESPPLNGVLRIMKPNNAIHYAILCGEEWLANWERIDSTFPYDPHLATWIGRLYQRLGNIARMPTFQDRTQEFVETALVWFEKAVERNPMNTEMRVNYSVALINVSEFQEGDKRLALYEQAIEESRLASALSPLSPDTYYHLAFILETYAALLDTQQETKAKATELRAEATRIREETAILIDRLVDVKRPLGQKKYSVLNVG